MLKEVIVMLTSNKQWRAFENLVAIYSNQANNIRRTSLRMLINMPVNLSKYAIAQNGI
jgi:hypothetical protein